MGEPSRREMIGSLGAALGAGGWLTLGAADVSAEPRRAVYTLPPLPYPHDALEPYIDAQTMELHHDRHHAGYVRGLNIALGKLEVARRTRSFADIKGLSQALAFHGSGHMLHSIFWKNMAPDGGGRPARSSRIARAMDRDFGGFEAFATHFRTAAATVEASGWGILGFEPAARRLLVLQAEKHQNLSMWGVVPLLVVDVWEHAYYLKYHNAREDYLAAFMHVIHWRDVDDRLNHADRLA